MHGVLCRDRRVRFGSGWHANARRRQLVVRSSSRAASVLLGLLGCVMTVGCAAKSDDGASSALDASENVVPARRRGPDVVCGGQENEGLGQCRIDERTASEMGSATNCSTNADCRPGGRCLPTALYGHWAACQCHFDACEKDSDCAADEACVCGGSLSSGIAVGVCGGYSAVFCHAVCVPAECRTDLDCGQGSYCVGSTENCSTRIERFACMNPGVAPCVDDDGCGQGGRCRFTGADWRCAPIADCEY